MFATVTDKGQVTVPKDIRDRLGIVPGSRLDFQIEPDGSLRVRPLKRGSAGLLGLLHDPSRAGSTMSAMDESVARHLAADDARVTSVTTSVTTAATESPGKAGKGRSRR